MIFKIIVLGVIVKCIQAAHQQEFRTPIEKEYKLEWFFKANWYNAYMSCRYHGLELATIETKEQHEFVAKLIRDSGLAKEYFWTSGTDLAQEGRYSWFSTGDLFKYTKWANGQPDNFGQNEHCMHFTNNQLWNDEKCSNEYYFICENPQNTKCEVNEKIC